MSDLDPRYLPYGSLALLTVESVSGASRMKNPALAAIALANAASVRFEPRAARAPKKATSRLQ
jgi:hypothetical protein